MAEIDVKNQLKNQSTEGKQQSSENRQQGLQRQSGGGVSRSRGWDPFAMNPAEFFSTNPFTLMRRMSEEMDRNFGQLFAQQGAGGSGGTWYPAIEISEHDNQLHVHAELPGLKPEDVKVEVADDALIIRGERKSEHEHRAGSAYRSERRYGQFYREIPLPEGVNAEQARAQFQNGVLEVTVPVPQQASNRREIPISTGETPGARAASATAGAGGSGSSSAQTGSSTQGGSSQRKA
jgi:HSP20 family protein